MSWWSGLNSGGGFGVGDFGAGDAARREALRKLEEQSCALRWVLQGVDAAALHAPNSAPAGWRGFAQHSYDDALHQLHRAILQARDRVEQSLTETDRALAELRQRAG